MLSSRSLNILNPSPPAISLTPAVSQGRSRSGTLPSYSSIGSIPIGSNNTNFNHSPLLNGSAQDPLGLPTMDHISLGLSGSNAVDIPSSTTNCTAGNTGGANNSRRMRSGSLFSTSSIWNDDAITVSPGLLDNASVHSASSGSFLSPRLSAQPLQEPLAPGTAANAPVLNTTSSNSTNGTGSGSTNNSNGSAPRNRSYTTTGISNILPGISDSSRLNFGLSNDMNAYLDSLLNNNSLNGFTMPTNLPINAGQHGVNGTSTSNISFGFNNARTRSQTYSGTTPTLLEATLHEAQYYPNQQQPQQQQTQQQQQHTHQPSQQNQQHNNDATPYMSLNSYSDSPHLEDDYDITKVNITTNFENPSLGPTKYILFDNLPHYVDSLKMWSILSNSFGNHRSIGSVKSIKLSTLNTSKIALIECLSIEVAMGLKASFNHLELVPGVIIYVAFVKLEDHQQQQQALLQVQQPDQKQQQPVAQAQNIPSPDKEKRETKPPPTDLFAIEKTLTLFMERLAANDKKVDMQKIHSIINKSMNFPNENYQDNFGPLPDPIPLRQFDSPKLRDLRKLLEQDGSPGPNETAEEEKSDTEFVPLSQLQLEELCLAMLDELPELCYDYIGNTIVQKLFTLVESPLIKLMMVKEITPYLTQLGIHKNGTWAIQKIINLCSKQDFQQQYLIGASLKPYSVKLFNDQFGNYVLQGCLKFGSPFNDFIFEVMLDNFLEISYGRFGARSIRTILEHLEDDGSIVSKEQILLVAGLIVQYANELAVNNNGSLLITWFLDTYKSGEHDDRYKILTDQFLPNLDTLCCHKLASLTILKLINNRFDLQLKQLIMDKIFGKFNEFDEEMTHVPSKLLETILSENADNSGGPVFIYKIISNANCLTVGGNDERDIKNIKYQNFVLLQIRRILLELNIYNMQPYKKLMDEVGLSSTKLNRSGSLNGGRRGKRSGRNKLQQRHNANANANGNQQNLQSAHNIQQHQHQHQHQLQHQHQQQQNQNGYVGGGYYNPQYQQYMMMGQIQPQNIPQHIPQSFRLDFPLLQQDQALMQQLEQLSLSSAKMGYNSNPDTPNLASSQKTLYM